MRPFLNDPNVDVTSKVEVTVVAALAEGDFVAENDWPTDCFEVGLFIDAAVDHVETAVLLRFEDLV